MTWHDVQKGEWIGGIAAHYGHKAWKPVWEHGKNAKLRSKRDPNLLVEGDRVWVSEITPGAKSGGTEAKHRFKLERDEDKFVLRFVEIEHYLPLFGPIPYTIKVGRHEKKGKITNEGETVEVPLGLGVEKGTLMIGDETYPLDIGGLDPIRSLSGMQARINNLGWDAGPVDNASGPRTRRGTRDFQAYYKIKVDGRIGGQTRGKAEEIYGC